MKVLLTTGFLLSSLGMAHADIAYTITMVEGGNGFQVDMVIPSTGGAVQLQIPNWAPGSYRLTENYKRIADVTAVRSGRPAEIVRKDNNTWEVSSGTRGDIRLSYKVASGPVTTRSHLTGPANYLYVKDRLNEACTLSFKLPAGWRATCGLEEKNKGFIAPDYDTLADNPVSVGVFESDYYTYKGVKHEIAYYGGDVSSVDRKVVMDYCQKVTDAESRFWGGLPFKKYVWHFSVLPGADGGWGLEHLSSTTMGIARGVGPGTVSVMAHEYFHAWNVKRIRSSVLGPFNYLELPKTGALWLLEGVTDYYADMLLYRYGIFDEAYFLGNIVGNTRTTRANPERLNISPYDSSYRVGEASNGQGNSAGFGVNYYNTGWLVGLVLDIEIRSKTDGKKSLDDVMYALYAQCKDGKAGFQEGDIRKHLIDVGGAGMGEVYDEWVMKPGELPVESQLLKFGYEMKTTQEPFDDPGFQFFPGRTGLVTVTRDAEELGLKRGDEILSVNGVVKASDPAEARNVVAAWQGLMKAGATVEVEFQRGEEKFTKSITVKQAHRDVLKVEPLNSPGTNVMKLRKAWAVPTG